MLHLSKTVSEKRELRLKPWISGSLLTSSSINKNSTHFLKGNSKQQIHHKQYANKLNSREKTTLRNKSNLFFQTLYKTCAGRNSERPSVIFESTIP